MKTNEDFFRHKKVNEFITSRSAPQGILESFCQKENDTEWKSESTQRNLWQKWLLYFFRITYISLKHIWPNRNNSNDMFVSQIKIHDKNSMKAGTWVAQSVEHLPSAHVMIPGSQEWAPPQAPCSVGSLLLPLPLPFPPPLVCSLCLSNK